MLGVVDQYLLAMLVLIGVVGVVGNGLILGVYARRGRQGHGVKSGLGATNNFIVALGFIDLVVCGTVLPYTFIFETQVRLNSYCTVKNLI